MSRPNQHPELFKWCQEAGLNNDTVSSLLWYLFAPPSLIYIFTIFDRLAHLQRQWPDQLGSLPPPFDGPESISQLRGSLRASVGALSPTIAEDFAASPGSGRLEGSPMYGYCLSTFPLWCALVIAPEDAAAKDQFDKVLACIVGEMMWFISNSIPREKYEAYLEAWQRIEDLPGRKSLRGKTDNDRAKGALPHPLPHIRRLASAELALRRLSNPDKSPTWLTIRERFPGAFTLDELASRLPKIAGVKPEISKHFQILAHVLALYRDEKSTTRRPGPGGRRGRWKYLNDGRYLEGKSWLIHSDLPPGVGVGRAGAIDLKQLPADISELLDEDYGYDELTDTDAGIYLHVPKGASADMPRAALKIINKWDFQERQARNQILEWSLDALTSRQVEILLREITALPEPGDRANIVAKMLLHACFVGSRNLAFISEHLEVTRPSARAGSEMDYVIEERSWRLTIKKPLLVTPEAQRSPGDDDYYDFLTIPDVLGFHSLAAKWMALNPDFVERQKVLPISIAERAEIHLALAGILTRLNGHGITPAKIFSGLARAVYQQHGDLACTALWSDWQPAHSRTLLYYLSPEASVVERVITEQLCALSNMREMSDPTPAQTGKVRRVGMRNCPSRNQVQDLVGSYRQTLSIDPGHDLDRIRAYSNNYVAYHVLFQTAALGYRSKIDPHPTYFEIDGVWFAVFRDKDSEGYNRRIVVVPPLFREHQLYFEGHRSIIRGAFIDECLAVEGPQMIWFENGRVVPFRPKFVLDTPPAHWKFKINALRRRMRTRLLEKKAPGEVVDAWMGHWKLGDCPWMSGSGFQMGELEAAVNHYVQEILIEDGWAPIPSMLRGGI